MTALIFKYNLTDQQWCDNRTVEEADNEFGRLQLKVTPFQVYRCLLKGEVFKADDFLYALSKSAIEEYIKEKCGL